MLRWEYEAQPFFVVSEDLFAFRFYSLHQLISDAGYVTIAMRCLGECGFELYVCYTVALAAFFGNFRLTDYRYIFFLGVCLAAL